MRISDWSSDVCSSDLTRSNSRAIVSSADSALSRHDRHGSLAVNPGRADGEKRERIFAEPASIVGSQRALAREPAGEVRMAELEPLAADVLTAGVRARFVEGVNGLRMHVLEAEIGRAHVELQSLMRISY